MAIGDVIRTPSGHEPVIARVVALKAEQTQLLYFAFTVEGGATMRISYYHAMIANGREVDAVDVKVGDLLPTPHGERAVTAIQRRVEGGGYHIVVPSSRYYADGVEASTYGTIVPGWVNYLGVRYMELRYRLGVPLVASGEGWLPSTMWVIKRYNQLGIHSPRAISYLCARHCPPPEPFAAKPNPRRHLARPTYPRHRSRRRADHAPEQLRDRGHEHARRPRQAGRRRHRECRRRVARRQAQAARRGLTLRRRPAATSSNKEGVPR